MVIILDHSAGNHWYKIFINIFLSIYFFLILLSLTYNQLSAGGFCKTLDEDEGYYVVYHSCYFGLVVLYIIFLITGTIDNITCIIIIITINRAVSLPMNTKRQSCRAVHTHFSHTLSNWLVLITCKWYWVSHSCLFILICLCVFVHTCVRLSPLSLQLLKLCRLGLPYCFLAVDTVMQLFHFAAKLLRTSLCTIQSRRSQQDATLVWMQ